MFTSKPIKPSCKGHIVDIQGKRYRADFWYGLNFYEFICVDEVFGSYHRVKKDEQIVSDAIKSGFVKLI
jgi:hypothetical protein